MAGVYRYIAADLRTNAILAELPLKAVSFSQQLNGGLAGGTGLIGELPLGDPKVDALFPIAALQPSRTALYVDRDGVLVWGGIIWTARYSASRKAIEIGATEFLSYLNRRVIADGKTYAAQDQLFIVRDLVNYAQAKIGGNIGITVGAEVSGVLRNATFKGTDYKPIAEAIQQLSSLDNSFDFAVDVAYDVSGVPQKYLHLSYPRRGRIEGSTGHVFEYPGNVTDYDWPEDGTTQAHTVYITGAGDGDTMLRSVTSDSTLIDAGYPLLEASRQFKDVADQATLDAHARATVAALSSSTILPVLKVRADQDPVFGSYVVGDDARIRITDERFNTGRGADGKYLGPGIDTFRRIIGLQVVPPDASPESVTVIMGATA